VNVIGQHKPGNDKTNILQYTLVIAKAEVECLDDYVHGGTIVGHDPVRSGVSFYITDTFGKGSESFCHNYAMGGYVHVFSFAEVKTAEDLENKLHGLTLPMTMVDGNKELKMGTVKVVLEYKE